MADGDGSEVQIDTTGIGAVAVKREDAGAVLLEEARTVKTRGHLDRLAIRIKDRTTSLHIGGRGVEIVDEVRVVGVRDNRRAVEVQVRGTGSLVDDRVRVQRAAAEVQRAGAGVPTDINGALTDHIGSAGEADRAAAVVVADLEAAVGRGAAADECGGRAVASEDEGRVAADHAAALVEVTRRSAAPARFDRRTGGEVHRAAIHGHGSDRAAADADVVVRAQQQIDNRSAVDGQRTGAALCDPKLTGDIESRVAVESHRAVGTAIVSDDQKLVRIDETAGIDIEETVGAAGVADIEAAFRRERAAVRDGRECGAAAGRADVDVGAPDRRARTGDIENAAAALGDMDFARGEHTSARRDGERGIDDQAP